MGNLNGFIELGDYGPITTTPNPGVMPLDDAAKRQALAMSNGSVAGLLEGPPAPIGPQPPPMSDLLPVAAPPPRVATVSSPASPSGYAPSLKDFLKSAKDDAEASARNEFEDIAKIIGGFGANSNQVNKLILERGSIAKKIAENKALFDSKKREELSLVEEHQANTQKNIEDRRNLFISEVDKSNKEINTILSDYKKASEINPNHFIESRTTGQMVAQVIALIAGGISAGFGGQNIGLQMLNKNIDNDIRTQIEKRDGLKDLLRETRATIGEKRAEHMSDLQVLQMASQFRRESAMTHLEKLSLEESETNVGLVAKDMLAQLKIQQAQDAKQTSLEWAKLRLAGYEIGVRSEASKSTHQIALPNDMAATGPVDKETYKTQVSERVASYRMANSAIDDAIAFARENPHGAITPSQRARAQEVANNLILQQMKLNLFGASFTKNEEKLIKAGSAGDVRVFNSLLPQLTQKRANIQNNMDAFLQQYNLAFKGRAGQQDAKKEAKPPTYTGVGE